VLTTLRRFVIQVTRAQASWHLVPVL